MRTCCVICGSKELGESHTVDKFPLCFTPTVSPASTDVFLPLHFVICRNCGCVQLKDLIDPFLLYNTPHNNTQHMPTWKEHHAMFCDFIFSSIKLSEILEIGGLNGALAELLLHKNKNIHYTILDLCDVDIRIPKIDYIIGNCETYDLHNYQNIVLSHVFEHLYDPNVFIKNLAKNNCKNIFISIPNMQSLVEKKAISIIHQEHTFFVDSNDINFMFSKAGYRCAKTLSYKEHSLFFQFIKDQYTPNVTLTPKKINDIFNIYNYYDKRFSSLKLIDEPFFIVPAGIWGQYIYYYLTEKDKANVIGFLDNDTLKIGKRLYGTNAYIYKMDRIVQFTNPKVLLCDTPYTEEIVLQLRSYKKDINVIIV